MPKRKSSKKQEKEVNDFESNEKDSKRQKKEESIPDVPIPTEYEILQIPVQNFKSEEEFEEHFHKIADFLLNECVIVANGTRFRLFEIEVYYTCSAHPDPYTHCNTLQFSTGNWYFHKTSSGYKNGTFRGLDISIGSSSNEAGGILLRSFYNMDTKQVICGPSNLVGTILDQFKVKEIPEFVEKTLNGNVKIYESVNQSFYLHINSKEEKLQPAPVYRSPRIGLNLNKPGVNSQLQKNFCFKFYRFFIYPDSITKGKHLTIPSMYYLGATKEEIAKLLGPTTKTRTIDKYIKDFENGRKESEDKYVGKKNPDNDDLTCAMGSLFRYLPKRQ